MRHHGMALAAAVLVGVVGASAGKAQMPPPPPEFQMEFSPPSLSKTGIVIAVDDEVFVVEDQYGQHRVTTLCPPSRLGLSIGDTVDIFGGMGEGGTIASGAITLVLADGSRVRVPDGVGMC